jgi:hypothetical protein
LKSPIVKSRFADEDLYFKHQTLDSDDGFDVNKLAPTNPTGGVGTLAFFFPVYPNPNPSSCACPAI